MFDKIFGRRAGPAPVATPAISTNPAAKIPGHIGTRRKTCWWEPIYQPELVLESAPYDWDLKRDAGPSRRYVAGETLSAKVTAGDTFTIKKATFRDCDFQGFFKANPIVMFDECQFINCDFAYSSWQGAHFRKCLFADVSISLATFEKCEFRDCGWSRIGIASRTDFSKTFVSNPGTLVGATISNTDPRDKTWKHRAYQWHRLHGTRAHVLRLLMLSHGAVGDEHVFYETVKLHELQRYKARMAEDVFDIAFKPAGAKVAALFKLLFHSLNYFLMALFGLTNGWGESVSRPCLVFAAIYFGFGQVYDRANFASAIPHPFQKSFDITLLVGYGNQIAPSDYLLTMVQNLHAALAIIVYSVFFSTMISKLSRAR